MSEQAIYAYTIEQAVEDGELVHPYPDNYPWLLLTNAIHEAIEAVDDGRTYNQKLIPLIHDAARIAHSNPGQSPLWTKGLGGNVTKGPVWIALNEKGGLTLMRPDEY